MRYVVLLKLCVVVMRMKATLNIVVFVYFVCMVCSSETCCVLMLFLTCFRVLYEGDITAFVVDDPDAVFLMDADLSFVRADLFKNYSVTSATGVTQTGISSVQLDASASGIASTSIALLS